MLRAHLMTWSVRARCRSALTNSHGVSPGNSRDRKDDMNGGEKTRPVLRKKFAKAFSPIAITSVHGWCELRSRPTRFFFASGAGHSTGQGVIALAGEAGII